MSAQEKLAVSEPTGLVTIERVVAFILGPIVTALAGRLSVWLAETAGVHLGAPEIVAAFGAGALGAASLVYKWLNGRQLEMSLKNNVLVKEIEKEPPEGFIATTARDLEGLAQSAAAQALASVHGPPGASPAIEEQLRRTGASVAGQGAAPSGP